MTLGGLKSAYPQARKLTLNIANVGGMSFYSPKRGFVCSNVISYEVVLADGSIVTASADQHPDLWRALKGGGGNFGIVTRFTIPAFPAGKMWTASLLSPGFRAATSLTAFHDYGKNATSGEPGAFDENAAPVILAFVYLTKVGLSLCSTALAYTESESKAWPEHFRKSPFKSIWCLHKAIKQKPPSQEIKAFGDMSPAGSRNVYTTTTIKHDFKTLQDVYTIWREAIPSIKHVENSKFVLVLQLLLPQWLSKGDPNMLGLEDCKDALVVIEIVSDWKDPKDDDLVRATARCCIEKMEQVSEANGASHPFRFQNYAAEWQRPVEGYGTENVRFMQGVSAKYDPDGLFQTGSARGFKLDASDKTAK